MMADIEDFLAKFHKPEKPIFVFRKAIEQIHSGQQAVTERLLPILFFIAPASNPSGAVFAIFRGRRVIEH